MSDTGVGIPAADHHRVFEEFQQVGDRDRQRAGTGLGLALTKRLVEAHGGEITLASVPGQGSTFTVRLPAAPDSPASDQENWLERQREEALLAGSADAIAAAGHLKAPAAPASAAPSHPSHSAPAASAARTPSLSSAPTRDPSPAGRSASAVFRKDAP